MRTLYQIDTFAQTPFTGSPTGIALNVQGLTVGRMIAIAVW